MKRETLDTEMKMDGKKKSSHSTALIIIVLTAVVLAAAVWLIIRLFFGQSTVSLSDAKELSKGDVVTFGSFEQDGHEHNGAEDIEWIVLDVRDREEVEADSKADSKADSNADDAGGRCALLLSRNVLQAIPLHNVYEDITWDECTLRTWLNGEFYEGAFSPEEKERVILAENDNHANPAYEPHGCAATEDHAFILSLEEAKAAVRTEEDRLLIGSADATEYAKIRHLETADDATDLAGKACWWLRTPGVYQYSAAFVDRDGTIFENGAIANHETYCGVRPAVWVAVD